MSYPRSGNPRRVAAGLLAGALAVFGLALAPQAGATVSVSTERLAGTNRYGTAQKVAENAGIGTPVGAVVATGENFPDALAASTLAGANGPLPIVLTETNNYTAEAKAALASIKAKVGATGAAMPIIIAGGTAAVSTDVEAAIKADGFTAVTRQGGTDRYDTANLIARAANTRQTGGSGLVGGVKTALFATGENFPDALAAGPMAYRNDLPILLVTSSTLPDATKGAITALAIKNAIIVGGTTVISNDVATAIGTATGDTTVERLAGSNRNSTAVAVGDYEVGTLSFPATSAVLATGLNFPDALASGVLAGVQGAPIVLTASLPTESQAFLDKYSYSITKLYVSGGTAVIDDATVTAAQTAAQTVANDTSAVNSPELVRVEAAGTSTSGATLGGPIYRYVFDEPVQTSPVITGQFKAWTPYGEEVVAGDAARDPNNTSAVLAAFTAANTVKVAEATVFTVAAATVADSEGNTNPESDINGPATRTFAAGTTRAPDLLSVAVVTANTVYDFTFDSAVTATDTTKFRMTDSDGAERSAVTSAVVQTTTTIVRVTFTAAPAGSAFGVRGAVLPAAVTGSTSTGALATNPGGAADLAGGNSDAPDLVSITADNTAHTVTFTFDEVVDTIVGGDTGRVKFHLYYRTVTTDQASLVSTDRSATDTKSIVARFPAGSVNENVAGAWVEQGAVKRPLATNTNGTDEEGIASSYTAGTYLGPNLTTLVRSNSTDLGGNITGVNLVFTFDKAATLTDGTKFGIVNTAGTRTGITTLSGATCTISTSGLVVTCASGTSSTNQAAFNAARLGVVASTAVTGTKTLTNSVPVNIPNHEERAPL